MGLECGGSAASRPDGNITIENYQVFQHTKKREGERERESDFPHLGVGGGGGGRPLPPLSSRDGAEDKKVHIVDPRQNKVAGTAKVCDGPKPSKVEWISSPGSAEEGCMDPCGHAGVGENPKMKFGVYVGFPLKPPKQWKSGYCFVMFVLLFDVFLVFSFFFKTTNKGNVGVVFSFLFRVMWVVFLLVAL